MTDEPKPPPPPPYLYDELRQELARTADKTRYLATQLRLIRESDRSRSENWWHFTDVTRVHPALGQHAAFGGSSAPLPVEETHLGYVEGYREWRVVTSNPFTTTDYTGLYGLSIMGNDRWQAGENVATCQRRLQIRAQSHDEAYQLGRRAMEAAVRDGLVVSKFEVFASATGGYWTASMAVPCGKDVGEDPECPHGFYAYTDRGEVMSLIWTSPRNYHRVSGIIEAYGTVVIGSKGIRASKARIKLLVMSARHDGGFPRYYHRRHDEMRDIAESYGVPVYSSWDEVVYN